MKLKTVDDKKLVEGMREALRKTRGHCPCVYEWNDENLCPCKDFRENGKVGETCHCGLYIKTEA